MWCVAPHSLRGGGRLHAKRCLGVTADGWARKGAGPPWCVLMVVALLSPLHAADSSPKDTFVGGLSVRLGLSRYAVRDEFISKERYSGASAAFSVAWSRFHGTHGFRLWADVVNSAAIRNFRVSAEFTAFRLAGAHLYPVAQTAWFQRPLVLLLGPVPEFSLYYRRQNIARGGAAVFDAYSAAVLISLGLHMEAVYRIHSRLQMEAFVQTSLMSLAGKFIDPRENHVSPVKVLLWPTGTAVQIDVAARYRLATWLSLKAGYAFYLVRITAWEDLLAASDQAYLTVSLSP